MRNLYRIEKIKINLLISSVDFRVYFIANTKIYHYFKNSFYIHHRLFKASP